MTLFAARGFDETRTRDIAALAKVDVALIAYRFGSKLGLWKAVVQAVGGNIIPVLGHAAAMAADQAPGGRLRCTMGAFIEFALRRPEICKFLLRDDSHDVERADWLYEHMAKPFLGHLLPLLNDAVAARQANAPHPELALLNFGYGVAGLVSRRDRLSRFGVVFADDASLRDALERTLVEPIFV